MQVKEVHTPLWIDRILKFDQQIHPTWLCDRAAVGVGQLPELRAGAIKLWLRQERTTVVVAVEGSDVIGYVVGDDDRETKPELGGRGGCRGRWMGVTPEVAEPGLVMQGMFDFLADRYGWIWGRITNPLIEAELLKFGCIRNPDEPTIFTYRKPG